MNYLNEQDIQEKLHLSERQAKAFLRTPGLPVVRIGRERLVSEETLDSFLKESAGSGQKIKLDYSKI